LIAGKSKNLKQGKNWLLSEKKVFFSIEIHSFFLSFTAHRSMEPGGGHGPFIKVSPANESSGQNQGHLKCSGEHQGSKLLSQFSPIFANFLRKNWRSSQKPLL
jgi:hypothetical protein